MKKLIIVLTLLLILFSSPSLSEWTKVGKSEYMTMYLDFSSKKKVNNKILWWDLSDYFKPTKGGVLSSKVYNEGDCQNFTLKRLSSYFYPEPMGRGLATVSTPSNPKIIYPVPNSYDEAVLKLLCKN